MTVILQRNEALELNRVEYRGRVSLDELKALELYQRDKPDVLGADCLNLVRADADFSTISFDELIAMFEAYRELFTPLHLQIFRRVAWLCETEEPKAQVTFWLSLDAKEGMASTVKQCDTFADAADWLLLMDIERGLLERGEGFEEIVRYTMPPPAMAR